MLNVVSDWIRNGHSLQEGDIIRILGCNHVVTPGRDSSKRPVWRLSHPMDPI